MPIAFTKITEVNPLLAELGVHSISYRGDYEAVSSYLTDLAHAGNSYEYYKTMNVLGKEDFFFFCYFILDLPVNDPFLIARVHEVQDKCNNTLDLWAREHFKYTIITYARTLWDLVRNPNERICIFSHTRGIAKAHLRRIKHCLESGGEIINAYPEIFYRDPAYESPKWSEDDGIYVKRSGNYIEASIEAWGLVDGMPTSKHFTIRIYDDIITERSVATAAQIKKATEMYRLSDPLGTRGGQKRIIGTRYSYRDTYAEILKQKRIKSRVYPAEIDEKGKYILNGIPVYMTKDELQNRFEEQGEVIYSAQMGQSPMAKADQRFRADFIRYWRDDAWKRVYLNLFLICDPASLELTEHDYSVFYVMGVDSRRNYWVIDMVRDKMNLGERWQTIERLVKKYNLMVVGYEKTGRDGEIQYFKERMEATGTFFELKGLKATARTGSKHSRIMNLLPIFQKQRIIFPVAIPFVDKQDEHHDLVNDFIYQELNDYPYCQHVDMLDALAKILDPDMEINFPNADDDPEEEAIFDPYKSPERDGDGSWMGV